MATIVANTSFAYGTRVYTRGVTYDTADAAVNAANTAVPHLFYATGGTKTATDTFVMRDSRAGGITRFVYVGEVIPGTDVSVTTCGNKFK